MPRQRVGGYTCIYRGYTSRTGAKEGLFTLVKDPVRLELWLKAANRENLLEKGVEHLSKNYKIFELHFQDKFVYQSETRKGLFANALPTVFAHSEATKRVTVLQEEFVVHGEEGKDNLYLPSTSAEVEFIEQVHSHPSVFLPCVTAQIQRSNVLSSNTPRKQRLRLKITTLRKRLFGAK